jgi:hypothetical protein
LEANQGLAIKGFELGSQGFLVSAEKAIHWLKEDPSRNSFLHRYMNGDDLKDGRCWRYVIDFQGNELCDVERDPVLLQHLLENVAPERSVNREARTAKKWWLFRRSGEKIRNAIQGLPRFIATTRTAKFRVFQFCDVQLRAESKIVIVAIADASFLAILSSRLHEVFARRIGGFLGVGNDPTYNHTDCFEKFPFPILDAARRSRLQSLGERLDSHRKRQQELHSELTITQVYNVLEKLRSGVTLTAKDKQVCEKGLVTVLKQIHDELDAAVFDAYGWPQDLTDEEILERLVALNHERAEEEKNGLIRWLRPEFQNPASGKQPVQTELELEADDEDADDDSETKTTKGGKSKSKGKAKPKEKAPAKVAWPRKLREQITIVRQTLQDHKGPTSSEAIAKRFKSVKAHDVEELLDTLASIGQARQLPDGRYAI